MKHSTTTDKTTTLTSSTSRADSSAGQNAVAIAPPAYGVDFVDSDQALGVPFQRSPLPSIQAKLKIGQPGDKYEREADRIAEQVMTMPTPTAQRQALEQDEEKPIQAKPLAAQITPLIQRQLEKEEEEEELIQAKSVADHIGPLVQRQVEPEEEEGFLQTNALASQITPFLQQHPAEEEEPLQTRSPKGSIPSANSNVQNRIQSLKGRGRPLSPSTRAFFEPRFGQDFADVRVHTDSSAAQTAALMQAKAFAVGNDVVFGHGFYSPGTSSGSKLLGHELTHVIQQGGTRNRERLNVDSTSKPYGTTSTDSQLQMKRLKTVPGLASKSAIMEVAWSYDYEEFLDTIQKEVSSIFKIPADQIEMVMGEASNNLIDMYMDIESEARIGRIGRTVRIEVSSVPTGLNQDRLCFYWAGETLEKEAPPPAAAESSTTAEFIEEGWDSVNEMGIVYQETGANLRDKPLPEGKGSVVIHELKQNTHVYILKHDKKHKWFAVAVASEDGAGKFGYVADWLIWRKMPEPLAKVYKIKKGDYPLGIAADEYPEFNVWGEDQRYVVNALVYVNTNTEHNGTGEPGLRKKDMDVTEDWFTARATKDVYIWLPSPVFLDSIYEKVVEKGGGTGSITADIWETVKKGLKKVAYGAAFIGGLVHGFVKSIVDTVVAVVELARDLLVSIFTANVLVDAYELWEKISQLTWDDIKEAFESWTDEWRVKLESSDPWVAGHAHGFLTGYIMGEAAMLLIGVGVVKALKGLKWGARIAKTLKGAKWSTKIGEAIKNSKAMQKLANGIDKARKAGGRTKEILSEIPKKLKKRRKAKKAATVAAKRLKVSRKMQRKILWGERIPGTNQIRGGHFRGIIDHPKYAVEIIGRSSVNPGCLRVKFYRELPGGAVSRLKSPASTLFPRGWSKKRIIEAIEYVANNPQKTIAKGATIFKQGKVRGILIEVVERGGKITAGYPL